MVQEFISLDCAIIISVFLEPDTSLMSSTYIGHSLWNKWTFLDYGSGKSANGGLNCNILKLVQAHSYPYETRYLWKIELILSVYDPK